MKKERNTNIELLRIISILMIVLSHYSVHSGINRNMLSLGLNRLLLEIISLGNIGVIIFVLITGYYSIDNDKPFKVKKMVSLYIQVLFYSIVIYLFFVVFGLEKFSIKELLKCFIPIAFKKYWFISAYLILYIFTPYLNKFINSLNRKEHFLLIFVNLLIFSILHTLTGQDYYGNELIQIIIYYFIGAYLFKYKDNIINKKELTNKLLFGSFLLIIVSVIIFDFIGLKYNIFGEHSTYFMSRTSILSIVFAVSMFNLFKNKKEYSNKYINSIASCVLAVYLISDNPLIRRVLWTSLFKVYKYADSNLLFIHLIICIFLTFIVCTIIEYIRKIIFGKTEDIIYDLVEKRIKKTKILKSFIEEK